MKKGKMSSGECRRQELKILPPHSALGGVLAHARPQPRMQGGHGHLMENGLLGLLLFHTDEKAWSLRG